MASVTNSEFNANTEGAEVAKAFAAEIRDKTILVTGVNRNGLGFSAAQAFASQSPTHLIISGRNQEKVQASIDALIKHYPNVKYRALLVDLSNQKSVRAAADEVLSWNDIPAINIVVNSAGIMGVQERTLSVDGIELHFATNHIGHWLMTSLIMPKLITAADGSPRGATRVVNVSAGSALVASMRWSDINFNKRNKDLPQNEQPNRQLLEAWGYKNIDEMSYVPLDAYNRSKVAGVLFGIGANKRLFEKHGILTLAVHPGVIKTELVRDFPTSTLDAVGTLIDKGVFTYKSFEAGSSTTLVAALDPKLAVGVGETHNNSENWGAFLGDCHISGSAPALVVSSEEAEKLWELSEKLVGQKFSW